MFSILAEEPEDRGRHRGATRSARSASFGFPVIDFSRCTACDDCARVVPDGRIQVGGVRRRAGRRVSLSYAACIQCRECVDRVPRAGRRASRATSRSPPTRASSSRGRASFDVDPATGRGTFRRCDAQPGPEPGRIGRARCASASAAGSGARSTCARWTREAATAASWRSPPPTNPVYDLERFGIHFVASPRHADLLLVTGPVTRNMEIALRRTYEATPEPRVVVAVGACGCSGGIFGEGTYAARRRRRPRAAGGRLHSRLSAASAGDPQRAARGDGRARGAPRVLGFSGSRVLGFCRVLQGSRCRWPSGPSNVASCDPLTLHPSFLLCSLQKTVRMVSDCVRSRMGNTRSMNASLQ